MSADTGAREPSARRARGILYGPRAGRSRANERSKAELAGPGAKLHVGGERSFGFERKRLTMQKTLGPLSLILLLAGCGNNGPNIPPELRELIDPGAFSSGATVDNLCFSGWRSPRAAGFDPKAFDAEPVCFDDFFSDPDARVLMVNTAAIWCEACEVEWGGTGSQPKLEDEVQKREADGLRLLGTLFQDADRQPATRDNLAAWARTFDIAAPFVLDPDFRMGVFADPLLQPFNMIIDTRTRTVITQTNGNQPAILFAEIDRALGERN